MRIIIAGTGEIAMHLATVLSNESQDVVVISEDNEGLDNINAYCNVMTHNGNPLDIDILGQLRMQECKIFVSLLPVDTDNLIACSMAKRLGAKLTVARVADYIFTRADNTSHLNSLGVDHIVNYEHLAATSILNFLHHPWAMSWSEFYGGELIVVGIKVEEKSPYAGMSLNRFEHERRDFHVALIQRQQTSIIPRGDDVIQPEDVLYLTITKEGIDRASRFNGEAPSPVKRVVMMGGSEIGIRLSHIASGDKFSFKLIEKDERKARNLQKFATNYTVIKGDGSKVDTLEYAGRADAYVALSKQDEVNILSCVTSGKMGIMSRIALVDDPQNIELAEAFGVNAVVNRRLLAATHIFGLLLDASAQASEVIALTDAEIVSVTAQAQSSITQDAVKHLKLPREITLAGMLHCGRGKLIEGNTRIEPGDQVIVVCSAGWIPKVQQLFG